MTKEFDAKNAEKSRRACAAMEDIANSMRRCGELRHDCEKGAKEVRQENGAVAYVCAKYVKLTNIRAFPNAKPDKTQALKVLEEAAEVVEAFKQRDPRDETHIGYATANVLDEIADTIQASCNLAAALGVTDLTPYLARCEERNRRRGRYE